MAKPELLGLAITARRLFRQLLKTIFQVREEMKKEEKMRRAGIIASIT